MTNTSGQPGTGARRVLFFSHSCYLDDSNGATVASRAMLEALVRRGFVCEALTGTVLESGYEPNVESWLVSRGVQLGAGKAATISIDTMALSVNNPDHFRCTVGGIPVTLHRSLTSMPHAPELHEQEELLTLLGQTFDRLRPDVLVTFGGDVLAHKARSLARARGASVVFALHNFSYSHASHFAHCDEIIVPSQFAADHYRKTLGIGCTVLPNVIDFGRSRASKREAVYLTFVNPSMTKGVYPFARIADELGQRRPDIPILVVESRGTEGTLVSCGIDLRKHGNVFLMTQTPDPRDFWQVTKLSLIPSLWWENQPLVAIEAMLNGIPVIGSDRGGLPETLGNAGIVLPLPERLTPYSHELPTPEEVEPWADAVIRLWDDQRLYENHSRLSFAESRRWSPELLEPLHVEFFQRVRPRPDQRASTGRPTVGGSRSLMSRSDLGAFLNGLGLLGVGAEVGVQNGYFSRQVLDQWDGKVLYMVDIWQPLASYRDAANVPAGEQIERMVRAIRQVSAHWSRVRIIQELSENAARLVPDGSLDWVYIDANHDHDSVRRDLEFWTPKVRVGGLIAGHDYIDGAFLVNGIETVFAVKSAVSEYFGRDKVGVTREELPSWYVTKSYQTGIS